MNGISPLIFVGIGLFIIALLVVIVSAARSRNSKRGDSANSKKKSRSKSKEQLLREAQKRLASNPKDMAALAILADVYFNEGSWEQAFLAYTTLSDQGGQDPDVDEFLVNMRHGICAMNLKRYEEAFRGLNIAHAVKPDVFEINFNLGKLEYLRKNYERAAPILSAASSAQTEHLETKKFLGMSLFRLKRFKDAIDKLKGVIDAQPDDKEAIYYLAYCYFENGQLEMAVNLFAHLRADPNFGPQASLMAGSIHAKNKEYDAAILDFEIGLKHKSIKKDVLLELEYRLATTLMKKQEISEATKHLNVIHEIDPSYKDVAALLKSTSELSRNEYLQTFLIGAPSDFVTLCRKLCSTFFPKSHTKIVDIYVSKGDYADILAEVETPAWEDLILFRYIRSTGTVGEFFLRDLYTKLKDLKAGRGFCVTAGDFSETAAKFVEARSIDLVNKDGLLKNLAKVSKV